MFGSIDGRFCGVPLLYSIETMHTKDFCGPKDQTEISVTIFFFNWENITPKFILLIKVGPESWLWYSHLCRAYAHTHTREQMQSHICTHKHRRVPQLGARRMDLNPASTAWQLCDIESMTQHLYLSLLLCESGIMTVPVSLPRKVVVKVKSTNYSEQCFVHSKRCIFICC